MDEAHDDDDVTVSHDQEKDKYRRDVMREMGPRSRVENIAEDRVLIHSW